MGPFSHGRNLARRSHEKHRIEQLKRKENRYYLKKQRT